ncbi:5379_t:CDS:2, partial [Diversispora eburnea]
MTNLLDLLLPELISPIIKNLPIQDLKNCYNLDDIWKTEVIREIRKRLIVNCIFIHRKTTVKTLIDPKSRYSSISKALVRKMDCYISRNFGRSGYPAVKELGIGAINSGKKVMVRGWIHNVKTSISIPDIFELEPQKSPLPQSLNELYENFLVLDKPEYELVLEKHTLSLQKFHKLLFSDYTFNFQVPTDLSEYYNSSYSETDTETGSISSDSDSECEASVKTYQNLPDGPRCSTGFHIIPSRW